MTKPRAKYQLDKIFGFLTDEERLTCQTVSKDYLTNTRTIAGPYKNFFQFKIATAGFFWPKETKDIKYTGNFLELQNTINKFKRYQDMAKQDCQNAWRFYQRSFVQPSLKPTLLYKLRDATFTLAVEAHFADGEPMGQNGRKYVPGVSHCWKGNALWMLSRIHLGASFTLVSHVNPSFMMRRDYANKWSALAKELVFLMKAGYTLNEKDGRYMKFMPTLSLEKMRSLTVHDLNPKDNEEIATHIESIREQKKYFDDIETVSSKVSKLLGQLAWPAVRFDETRKKLVGYLSEVPSCAEFKNLNESLLLHFLGKMNEYFLLIDGVPLIRKPVVGKISQKLLEVLSQIAQRADMIINLTQDKLQNEINRIFPELLLDRPLFGEEKELDADMQSRRELAFLIFHAFEYRLTTPKEVMVLRAKREILTIVLSNKYGRTILKKNLLTLKQIDQDFDQYRIPVPILLAFMSEEGVLALENGFTLQKAATLTVEKLKEVFQDFARIKSAEAEGGYGSFCKMM